MEPVVGIDLGTTNSEVAFIINEHAEIIKDNDSGIIPSCVGLDENGQVIVGIEALNRAILAPESTILSVKRLMGRNEKIVLKDSTYLPQEISAFILKALKERAEKIINQKISKAVITVPAYFTDIQRNATKEAGEIAGLEVVRIINEPTSAALAYESDNPGTQRILVYDLGGGTFDVSIVKIENGVVEVLSSTGDNYLGGDDFDLEIVNLLANHLAEKHNISVTNDKTVMARLRHVATAAKITLSNLPYVKIEEDHIAKKDWKNIHLSYELSRVDFEEMIDQYLSKTNDSISKALKDANMLPSAIDKIILVGGSTRIPKISEMITEKFGKLPHSEIDPDLCVALGAAIQAGREMGMQSSILLDITPYTFGTSAMGYVDGVHTLTKFVPLIYSSTKLPAEKSEAFYTAMENQEEVEITVYQGEQPNALDNVLIGKYLFNLTKAPMGSIIIIRFELDINGLLKIEAIEKETGKKINAIVENALSDFSDHDLADSKAKIEQHWNNKSEPLDVVDSDKKAIPDDLHEIIKKAEIAFEEAPEEDRDEIINLIEDIKDAVNADKLDNAKEFGKELEEILFYLG